MMTLVVVLCSLLSNDKRRRHQGKNVETEAVEAVAMVVSSSAMRFEFSFGMFDLRNEVSKYKIYPKFFEFSG